MFDHEEILTLMECASVALADASVFDFIVEKLDISDESMIELREKLHNYLNEELKNDIRRIYQESQSH